MKVLVSISSCRSYEESGLNSPMRDTWLSDLVSIGWDYKVFAGEGADAREDTVVLPVEDALHGLTVKCKAKARWAVEQGYDWVFSCFPDTFAIAERLLRSGFDTCDYLGNVHQFPGSAKFCQGGTGYFLSRRACQIIYEEPSAYLNDDTFVGDTLAKNGIHPVDHRGFTAFGPGPLRSNESVTNHLSTQPNGFTKECMYEEWRRWKES